VCGGGGGGGARDTESKTRTPHKDVGNEEVPQNCFVFDVVNVEK